MRVEGEHPRPERRGSEQPPQDLLHAHVLPGSASRGLRARVLPRLPPPRRTGSAPETAPSRRMRWGEARDAHSPRLPVLPAGAGGVTRRAATATGRGSTIGAAHLACEPPTLRDRAHKSARANPRGRFNQNDPGKRCAVRAIEHEGARASARRHPKSVRAPKHRHRWTGATDAPKLVRTSGAPPLTESMASRPKPARADGARAPTTSMESQHDLARAHRAPTPTATMKSRPKPARATGKIRDIDF